MPDIKFNFRGQNFKATVPDAFLLRPEAEQRELLASQLKDKYETKIPKRGTDAISQKKGVLDYIGLLERPFQGLKVGFRESKLGGDIYAGLNQIDLTPKEGFFEGWRSGWMGEDEVRTQDFLPENMNPLAKGILGFVGDVATDPLTYVGAGAVRALGGQIKKAGQVTGATETLRKAGSAIADVKVGESQIGVADVGRLFNVYGGEGAKVKGLADESDKLMRSFEIESNKELPALQRYFAKRSKETGRSFKELEDDFVESLERPRLVNQHQIVNEETGEIIKEAVFGDLIPLPLEIQNRLGPEGVTLLNKWEGITKGWVDQSEAFGMPITPVKNRGYFPRVITTSGRKLLEKNKNLDEIEGINVQESLDNPYGEARPTGYRTPREREYADLTTKEYNKMLAPAMAREFASVGLRKNPLDVPYEIAPETLEKAPEFFHRAPFAALGLRWNRQDLAMQNKWFIDEITDNYRSTYAPGVPNVGFLPEKGIGVWITKNPDGNGYLKRERSVNYNDKGKPIGTTYTAIPFTENVNDFRKVEGINELKGPSWYVDQVIKNKRLSKQNVDTDLANESVWTFVAPKQVARNIEDQLALMSMDPLKNNKLKTFLRNYDLIQNSWKAWTLGVRPAYHTRNAIGNIYNAYNITGLGENPIEAVKVFAAAAKLQYYGRFGGNQLERNKLLEKLDKIGIKFDTKPKNIKEKTWRESDYMNTGFSMEDIYNMGRSRGISAGHYTADNIRDVQRQAEAAAGIGSKVARTIGAENPIVQKGFAVGGTIEGNARYAVLINTLRQIKKNPKDFKWTAPNGDKIPLSEAVNNKKYYKTKTVTVFRNKKATLKNVKVLYTKEEIKMDVAANQVKAALFDYKDVSKFERDVLKRFMPFYTWTRKNIPAQLKHLVLNPQRAEKLAIAKQQFEHETGDLDYSDYGKYWGQRVPVFLGKENQGVIKAFTLLNILPMADLQRLIQPGPLLAEMTSPAIKAPLEILANYDTFRGSKIAKQRFGSGESKDFLGVSLPPRLWHLAQVIVPLTEINRLNPAGVFGERAEDDRGIMRSTRAFGGVGALRESSIDAPEAARWIRFFTGGTTYDVDLGKQRYMMNKNLLKDIRSLKSAIKWAARNSENQRVKNLEALLEQVLRQEITDPMGTR